jgi:hypothetical protein
MNSVVTATAWNIGRKHRAIVGEVAAKERRWKWGAFGNNSEEVSSYEDGSGRFREMFEHIYKVTRRHMPDGSVS